MARITSTINASCYQPHYLSHKQTLNGIIFLLATENAECFEECYYNIVIKSLHSLHFLGLHFFLIFFCLNRVAISYIICIHSKSTSKLSSISELLKLPVCGQLVLCNETFPTNLTFIPRVGPYLCVSHISPVWPLPVCVRLCLGSWFWVVKHFPQISHLYPLWGPLPMSHISPVWAPYLCVSVCVWVADSGW